MILGKCTRKGYGTMAGLASVIISESKLADGKIITQVQIPGGPFVSAKGRSFEELCELYNVTEVKDCVTLKTTEV